MSAVYKNQGMVGIFPTIRCVSPYGNYPVRYFHSEERSYTLQKMVQFAFEVQRGRDSRDWRSMSTHEVDTIEKRVKNAARSRSFPSSYQVKSQDLDMQTMVDEDPYIVKDSVEEKEQAYQSASASVSSQSPLKLKPKLSALATAFERGDIRNRGLDLRDQLMAAKNEKEKLSAIQEFFDEYQTPLHITKNQITFDSGDFAWDEVIEIQDACNDYGFLAMSS